MGVYIPDMKLPKSCRKCMISQPDGCGWICPIIESKPIVDGRVNSRHPHCPLVPVTVHGRLGDLDALKAKAIERSEKCGEMVNVLDKVITVYDISTAPTIIEAEEDE